MYHDSILSPEFPGAAAPRAGLTVNGASITARVGENILDAARRHGIDIPSMCSDPRIKPTGSCGLCVVEIEGVGRARACETLAKSGMVVATENPELAAIRKEILSDYLGNHNAYCEPPCQVACPAGIDIAGYLRLIAEGKYAESTALTKIMLPLPGVIGRVCPHPCETACRRIQVDGEPVAICWLKRFAADEAVKAGAKTQPDPKPATGKRIAIIGGGPAGLSAAYYCALDGHAVTIFDAKEKLGGMLRYGIPPYRLPDEVVDQEIDDILSLGVAVRPNLALGRDYQIADLRAEGFDAIFLGVGASIGKAARIAGESAPNVLSAIEFLEEVNKGKIPDIGDKVIVIGGGFTAADAVRTARRLGASSVAMSYRRSRAEMPASPLEIHEAELEGVKLDLLSAPVEIKLDANGRATGIVSQRMELGEPDASGRRSPRPVAGSEYFTPADTILLAIGQDVEFDSLKENLTPTKWKSIEVDEATMMTSMERVFSAGDCQTGAATVVEAIGNSRRAAFAISAWLRGESKESIAKLIARRKPKLFPIAVLPKIEAPRAEMPTIDAALRNASFGIQIRPGTLGAESAEGAFTEVETGFTEAVARREAERCLQCVCQEAGACDLQKYSYQYGAGATVYTGTPATAFPQPLESAPFFVLNAEKCIRCHDCVRICDEVQHRSVYTVGADNYPALVSGTLNFRDTECNNCGQCVSACPTGALKDVTDCGEILSSTREKTDTVCSYCGVGCQLTLETENGKVVAIDNAFGTDANEGNLCVKGRFGFDFINHPDRLTKPLIRRNGKNSPLEEASWDEAIQFVARRLLEVKEKYGSHAISSIASSRATNEDNYVFQKLIRCAIGTNNIDHCARLCHMASAVALKQAVGSSAPSASTPDIRQADAFLVIGSNTTETHPVISSVVFKAKYEDGAKIVVIDPRRIEMVEHADVWLRPRLGANVALINGLAHVILEEGLANEDFITKRTENFEAFRDSVKKYTPEYVSRITGVPAERIREAARIFAKAQRGMILWGMGITQHLSGVDGALGLANLSLLTGHLGRPGAGFIPLRGQNNVQGCSDMQGQHNALPGYHSITDPQDRAKFEAAWGVKLPEDQFLTVVEMEEAAVHNEMKAMYIMGENPMGSSPDINEVDHGLRNLEFLVVQEIFLSETAKLADAVLPVCSFAEKDGTFTNTERRVQLLRPAIPPVGEARPDWQILCDVSTAMGYPMSYPSSAAIMEEIASLVPSYAGIRHERLNDGGIQWPCPDTEHPGTRFLYAESFPTPNGLGHFSVIEQHGLGEEATDEYPLILSTGRLLEHYHTGTMTRRARGLDAMKPRAALEINPEDARRAGARDGETVRLSTRRGSVEVKLKITARSPEGVVFLPFHFVEAAANRLTSSKMDPASKTPGYKSSAARIERLAPAAIGKAKAATPRSMTQWYSQQIW